MERMTLPFKMRFEKAEAINSTFTRAKCYVMALGKNANRTYFEKGTVEEAIPLFKNIPIIAFIYEGNDGEQHLAGHQEALVVEDGKLRHQTLCWPDGTVPDKDFWFEDVVEADGTTATYLVCEVILWSGKYPEIMSTIFDSDTYWNHSMEIDVYDKETYSEDSDYIEVKKFEPTALCLLGKSDIPEYNVKPCFPSSSVVSYSANDEFAALMKEFKFALGEYMEEIKTGKGGHEQMNQELIDSILKEFNLAADQLGFEITDDMDEATFRARLSELEPQPEENPAPVEEPAISVEEPSQEPVEQPEEISMTEQKFALASDVRKALMACLSGLEVHKENYHESYWLMDYSEAHVYAEHRVWSEDEGITDYLRYGYAYNAEVCTAELIGEPEQVYCTWLTKEERELLESEKKDFELYKADHSYTDAEYSALKDYKDQREKEDHDKAIDASLAKFEDLNGNSEFEALKGAAYEIANVDELEEKCFAIRGRTMKFSANNGKQSSNGRLPIVGRTDNGQSDFEELYEKYGH